MVASVPSVVTLTPWENRLFADTARVIVVNWHRQAGKDFTVAGKAVDHAIRTGQDWYIVSITQRQADATFAKCRQFASMFKQAFKAAGSVESSDREFAEYDKQLDRWFRCTARTLHLPGGGTVTALPGRDPDTLAGLTGNVIFTEFGLFPKGGYDHWRVVFPLATRGYQVLVISTPRGKNTKFYELATNPNLYSYHFQPITRSVEEGFQLTDNQGRPCSLADFETLYGDPVGWRREYLCEFTGDLDALIKWSLLERATELHLARCRVLEITGEAGWQPGWFAARKYTGRIELGWDVARRGDLSVLWANEKTPGRPACLADLVIMRNVQFAAQRQIVTDAMGVRSDAVGAGDATGLGMDSNETLQTRYGDRWRPVMFTAATKRDLASRLVTAYGDGEQGLPAWGADTAADLGGFDAKAIAADLYALQRDGSTERLSVSETPNPLLAESHCDIAWANALALEAATIRAANPGAMLL